MSSEQGKLDRGLEMITTNLTAEEYRILTDPTRIEEWGAQQEVARKVQDQILALTDDWVRIDDFDIAAINKSIEALRMGSFIAIGNQRAGGWNTSQWNASKKKLQAAVTASNW